MKKTQSVLSGNGSVKDVSVDLAAQRVVLTSSLPSEDVKSLIETTGKRAVLLGMGAAAASTNENATDVRPVSNQSDARPTAAAVAMLGGLIGSSTKSSVVGVVRFSQGGGNGSVYRSSH